MSMGYGELEANNDKQGAVKVQRKSISLKLKRESQDTDITDKNNSFDTDLEDRPVLNQAESLNWNFKVKLAGEKKGNKENLLNFCEKCKKPILVHGRLIPCKHFLCLNCAQKGTRNCFKCDTPIQGIQPVPKIFVCANDGTRHSLKGCRKSYLNFPGLDQHQKLRHSNMDDNGSSADIDSDGELSVNKQHGSGNANPAPPQQPRVSVAPTPTLQFGGMPTGAPLQPPVSLPHVIPQAALSRPLLFTQLQPPSVAQPMMTTTTRLTFATPSRPTTVMLFPRPQITVTSMGLGSLLVPPQGMGPPRMLTLPGMLPQPASLMPILPPAQFPPVVVPEQLRLPMPPSVPMPEGMRDKIPASSADNASHDTPPPPPPARVIRSEPSEMRQTEPEFMNYNTGSDQYDNMPRDPRKARDIPPPPPPRNGNMR